MKLLLYHGSDQQVDRPEWNHGSRYRDFGQCFYTTHSRAMASNWAEKNFVLHPAFDVIVGPVADRGLTEQFAKIETEGLTFANCLRRN